MDDGDEVGSQERYGAGACCRKAWNVGANEMNEKRKIGTRGAKRGRKRVKSRRGSPR